MTDDNYRTIIKFQQEQYEKMLTGEIPIPTVAKNKSVALKPCPFCGYKDIRINELDYGECQIFHPITSNFSCPLDGWQNRYDDRNRLIIEWNRRVKE